MKRNRFAEERVAFSLRQSDVELAEALLAEAAALIET
jgi:hypothetical protein